MERIDGVERDNGRGREERDRQTGRRKDCLHDDEDDEMLWLLRQHLVWCLYFLANSCSRQERIREREEHELQKGTDLKIQPNPAKDTACATALGVQISPRSNDVGFSFMHTQNHFGSGYFALLSNLNKWMGTAHF